MRGQIFKKFLEETHTFIDYNGEHYNLVDKHQKLITTTKTADEMKTFIDGYNLATQKYEIIIEEMSAENIELNKRNEMNVENYEKIIEELHKNMED